MFLLFHTVGNCYSEKILRLFSIFEPQSTITKSHFILETTLNIENRTCLLMKKKTHHCYCKIKSIAPFRI